MSRLEVRGLSRYDPVRESVIEDVSFVVEDGRIAALFGPPGSGTTATLRQIAGLDRQDAGAVLLGERALEPIPAHRRGIGMVGHDLALFSGMDVEHNVAFGLRMRRWPRAERERRVTEVLRQFGLSDRARSDVESLAPADRLRVALARALAPQPALLLLDAPLAGIEEAHRRTVREWLRDALRDAGTTTLVATHDLRDAVAIADDLVVMDEGRVLQAGSLPRMLAGPGSVRVGVMFGYAILITGEVRSGRVSEEGVGTVRIPEGFPLERAAVVLAHPSTLLGVPPDLGLGTGVTGEVVVAHPYGPMHVLELRVGERRIEVRWEWDLRPPAPGTRVEVAARPGTLRFFNAPWPILAPEPTHGAPALAGEAAAEGEGGEEAVGEEETERVGEGETGGGVAGAGRGDEGPADHAGMGTEPESEAAPEPAAEHGPGAAPELQPPPSAVPPRRTHDTRDERAPESAPPARAPRHPRMPAFE